jgi:hypothetical protein
MLPIEGEPFPAAETTRYFIVEVSAVELAELKRGNCRLLRALEPSGLRAAPESRRQEPLRRVHECVFGVLALESEP